MSIAPKAKINIGDLKHICEIQRLVTTTDDFGFQSEEWTTIANPRCKVDFDDRLMREIFKDDGINTTSVPIFTFRYFEGLTTKDRVLYKNRAYEIYGFNNINEESKFYKVWARGVD